MKSILKNTISSKGWLKYWSMYLILMPFYFFSAGNPQISDIFIVIIIVVFIGTRKSLFLKKDKYHKVFFAFIVYATIVNLILSMSRSGLNDKGLPWFYFTGFYIYNIIVFSFTIRLFYMYGILFLKTTLYSLIFVSLLQMALSFVLPIGSSRDSLFFANPNQLGYYAICILTIILLLEKYIRISKVWTYLSILLCIYFTFLSVSKAAIGSIMILALVYLISNNILKGKVLLRVIILSFILILSFMYTPVGITLTEKLQDRVNNSVKPSQVSEWEYRGYDRISNHPGYLFLGAGEGAYNRFDTYIDNHEIHSSFGTIIFCYGIPGFLIFILFLRSISRGVRRKELFYLIPILTYGITHMGLRFTVFYIVLAIFPIIKVLEKNIKIKN